MHSELFYATTTLTRTDTLADWGGICVPGSVIFLEELLAAQGAPYDADEVLAEISGEYARAGMYEQQLETARRRMLNLPRDLLVQIEVARRLSYSAASTPAYGDEAKRTIAEAVQMARQKNVWVRSALSEQAWIGIRLSDSGLFATAMEELIQDVNSGREFEVDSRLFHEILEEIPRGFCPPELVERYRAAIGHSD